MGSELRLSRELMLDFLADFGSASECIEFIERRQAEEYEKITAGRIAQDDFDMLEQVRLFAVKVASEASDA